MTNNQLAITFLLFSLTLLNVGCNDDKKQKKNIEQHETSSIASLEKTEPAIEHTEDMSEERYNFTDSLASYTAEEKEQAISAIDTELQILDVTIQQLEDELSEKENKYSSEENQQRMHAINLIKQERQSLEDWGNKLRENNGEAWDDVKQGFSGAYATLMESMKKAKYDFENGEQEKEGTY